MPIFYTDKTAKAEIATLNERIESLEADNESAANQIETLGEENKNLSEQVATLTAEKAAAAETVEGLQSQLTEANGEIEAAEAKVTEAEEKVTDFDEKVEAAALAKFESLGGQPIKSSKHDDEDGPKKITREQFNAMSAAERTEFSKAGGILK